MTRLSRRASTSAVAGIALALGGLLLISSSKSAYADGYFQFDYATQTSDTPTSADPGSGAFFTAAQTSTASSYSGYDAKAGTSDLTTKGRSASGEDVFFKWVNGDGNSPAPTGQYDITSTLSIDGTVTTNGGTSADSYADTLSDSTSDTRSSYKDPSNPKDPSGTTITPYTPTANELDASGASLRAETSASPDNSYNPASENYGQPTAAAAGATDAITVVAVTIS